MTRLTAPRRTLGEFVRRGGLGRWVVAGIGIIAVAAIAALSFAVYRHAHEDDRLRRASDRLSTPAGWKLVDVTEESGSPFFCIVSCPHAEVTKVFRTDVEPLGACAVIRRQITREITRAQPGGHAFCGWAALDDVGPDATVGASAETAAEVRQLPSHFWPGGAAPTDDATYVFVTFTGGVT